MVLLDLFIDEGIIIKESFYWNICILKFNNLRELKENLISTIS